MLAMTSFEKMLGLFPSGHREWIEFIIVAVLLWLLMVVAISELELNSVS
jgi:nitrate reductase NapE component